MRATSTFTVSGFESTDYATPIETGLAVGFAYMDKPDPRLRASVSAQR